MLDAGAEGRRADQAGAVVPVADDSPSSPRHPGGEAIGLAKAILVAQALEVAFLEMLGRRLVVTRDPELEWKLRHPLDRIRRNPGNRCRTDDSMRDMHPLSRRSSPR